MAERPRIVTKGGFARGLLPVYSLDQFLATAAFLGTIFAVLMLVAPDMAAMLTLSGGLGGLAVGYMARPAYLLIDRSQLPRVVEALRSIDYRYVAERDHWVPPIPRWQRWTYNFVRVEDEGSGAQIYGPANALHFIAGTL